MERLIDLVNAYRRATGLAEQIRCTDRIVVAVGPRLHLFVHGRCRPGAAEDIMQEVLVALAQGLPRIRGNSDAECWTWCYRIARNKIYNDFQQKARHPEETWDAESLWQAVEASERTEPISAADRLMLKDVLARLKQVKPPCYDYLWGHFFLGWSYGELANVFGLPSEDAAGMQVRRCLKLAESLTNE